jgi:hypothetical protein
LLDGEGLDEALVIEMYYNQGLAWEDIHAKIKRREDKCQLMHRDTLYRMARRAGEQ